MKHRTPKEIFNFRSVEDDKEFYDKKLKKIHNNFEKMLTEIFRNNFENIPNIINNIVTKEHNNVVKALIETMKYHVEYELELKERIFFLADLTELTYEKYEKLENLIEKYLYEKNKKGNKMGVFKDFYRVSEANDYFINMSIPIMQEKILNLKNSIHEENLEKFIPGIKDHLSFQLRKIKNEIENAEKLIEKLDYIEERKYEEWEL